MLVRALLLVLVASLLGCPPDDKRAPAPAGSGACTSVGQSCELTPGKLGACVKRDDCTSDAGCFHCQSQH